MSLALEWLGGTEDEVLLARAVAKLVGQWMDRQGSIYTLTQATEAGKIDVLTVRPSGAQRYTDALITVRGCILQWGRSTSWKFSGTMDAESNIIWLRGRSKFQWRKMQ